MFKDLLFAVLIAIVVFVSFVELQHVIGLSGVHLTNHKQAEDAALYTCLGLFAGLCIGRMRNPRKRKNRRANFPYSL